LAYSGVRNFLYQVAVWGIFSYFYALGKTFILFFIPRFILQVANRPPVRNQIPTLTAVEYTV
jgi:hypothetical protein